MKNIVTLVVVLIMSVVNSVAQINTELYERKVLTKLNKYRIDNGLDTFVNYNMVRTVAKIEFDFETTCSKCGDNPKFNSNMQKVLGVNVYKSYNAKIVDFWDLNNLIIGNDVEEVLSSEVVKKFRTDKREDIISKSLKGVSNNSTYNIGIYSQVKDNIFYSILILYITP